MVVLQVIEGIGFTSVPGNMYFPNTDADGSLNVKIADEDVEWTDTEIRVGLDSYYSGSPGGVPGPGFVNI